MTSRVTISQARWWLWAIVSLTLDRVASAVARFSLTLVRVTLAPERRFRAISRIVRSVVKISIIARITATWARFTVAVATEGRVVVTHFIAQVGRIGDFAAQTASNITFTWTIIATLAHQVIEGAKSAFRNSTDTVSATQAIIGILLPEVIVLAHTLVGNTASTITTA